jgi:hypothetical protein
VRLFEASGALGAGNARGLGAFVTAGYGDIGDATPYVEHIAAHAEEIREVLRGVRALGPSKPAPAADAKPAKGAKKSAKVPMPAAATPADDIDFGSGA